MLTTPEVGGILSVLYDLGVIDCVNQIIPNRSGTTDGRVYMLAVAHELNVRSLQYAREHVGSLLPVEDHDQMKTLAQNKLKDEGPEAKSLLHGDTGVHNFVFRHNTLTGVIDPSPMLGPVLYDFTYAFCSSPDDLNLETLMETYRLLRTEPMEQSKLIEEVVFQLYCRIGICSMYHPHDMAEYLEAWKYWRALL